MNWATLLGPAVVAAIVSGIISVVGFLVSARTARRLHREKLTFDERQAEQKFEFDKALAERRFDLDSRLADRKRRQELAEEVLSGFHQVRDLIRAIRSPMSFEGEAKKRVRLPSETDALARTKDNYHVILERLHDRHESIANLMSRQYRMQAWFGAEAAAPFDKLHQAITSVRVSAEMLVSCAGEGFQQSDPDTWKQWRRDIWWGHQPDPIEAKVDEAVAAIEAICRPILGLPR